jgi:hypothetical protein
LSEPEKGDAMKKVTIAITFLVIAFSLSLAQRTAPTARTRVVSAKTISGLAAGKKYELNLTRKGTIYNLAPGVDYSRIRVRTAKGEMTIADLLKKSGKTVTGNLRVGMTSDIRNQKLGLARIGGGSLNYNCQDLLCTCSGDDDCNDMFTKEACGFFSMCDERGCWCLLI